MPGGLWVPECRANQSGCLPKLLMEAVEPERVPKVALLGSLRGSSRAGALEQVQCPRSSFGRFFASGARFDSSLLPTVPGLCRRTCLRESGGVPEERGQMPVLEVE